MSGIISDSEIGDIMTTSEAHVATAHANRYLQQLCNHWSHKFVVTFDPENGRIAFSEGRTVTLAAHQDRLLIPLSSPGADGLGTLEQIVADHIKRFAFREELVFDWVRVGSTP